MIMIGNHDHNNDNQSMESIKADLLADCTTDTLGLSKITDMVMMMMVMMMMVMMPLMAMIMMRTSPVSKLCHLTESSLNETFKLL